MKSKSINKICEACAQPFTTTRPYKRYCSSECRNRAARKSWVAGLGQASCRPCIQCGTEFQPHPERPKTKLCSRKCQGLWVNANGLGPRHDDDVLLARIISAINTHDRCLSQDELVLKVEITHKVLLARGWSMDFLYKRAGRVYEAPALGSRFEDRVYVALSEIFPDEEIETDKTLPGMRGVKNGELRADFLLPGQNLMVEADGKQHLTGRGDSKQLAYIQANDRLKDEYAASNGIMLIRLPQTADTRSIKAQLLRGVRRARPAFKCLHPSNKSSDSGPGRRLPKRRNAGTRPRRKTGDKGEALEDVCCRGCHARPSYKNINTYLCATCWDVWNKLRRSTKTLNSAEVEEYKAGLISFLKTRDRYVWQAEAYLYHRPVTMKELKRHNISIPAICRDLRLFAPAEDRITRETIERVQKFALDYLAQHGRMPDVRAVISGAKIDHTNLWSCMDYEEFVSRHGGKVDTDTRYRFRDDDDFRHAAAQVVRDAGCPLHMTVIFEELGISYPAYLANYGSVSSDEIHDAAGISRDHSGVASLLEAAGETALTELGWEVERQASFPGLIGVGGRPLKFDFRLVGGTILVEIDGPQHFNPSDSYYKESGIVHDGLKEDFASRNGYQVIRVDARVHNSPKSIKAFLRPLVGLGPRHPDKL